MKYKKIFFFKSVLLMTVLKFKKKKNYNILPLGKKKKLCKRDHRSG